MVAAAGAVTLFVELALIRYIPGQVRVFGYFTNFVMLAAFLGLGLGMLAHRRWPGARLGRFAAVAVLAVVALAEGGARLNVLPEAEQFLFLEYSEDRTSIPLLPFLAGSWAMLAAIFVPLGYFVGETLTGDRPLFRYGLNVAGSLAGILFFAALSGPGAPVWLWMFVAGLAAALPVGWGGVVIAVMVSGISFFATRDAVWSPYQKVSTGPINALSGERVVMEWELPRLTADQRARLKQMPPEVGFTVRVNDDTYQTPLDLSAAAVARMPELAAHQQQHDWPFLVRRQARRPFEERDAANPPPEPAQDVLVLGAGTGNDVAAALRAGVARVDAVEIDPEILRLGRERHPEKPYDDPRVTVHLDDARRFLARTDRRYDIVVYGQLDSHVLLSHRSNLRLDSFVFTRESFELARKRLKPDGLLVVSHAVGTGWFIDRMRLTLGLVFGKPPLPGYDLLPHAQAVIYVTGEKVMPGPGRVAEDTLELEDDWPFVYLQARRIPRDYLIVMLVMGVLSFLAVRAVAGRTWSGLDARFFALGAGFVLLEARGVSVLSVLAGSTWIVSSAIFAGVLVMSLLATIVASRVRSLGPWFALLAVFLALDAAVPVGSLASLPFPGSVIAGALLLSLPLFAAGVLFARSLAEEADAGSAVASNLLGALLGGLVEYTAMATGFRYLLLPAGLFYLIVLLTTLRRRRA